MKVTGQTMIFKNDRGYSTTISNKQEDGTYDNMYITVGFKKGVEVPSKTKINILDSFLTFYKTKDGMPKVKLFIMSFEQVDSQDHEITDSSDLPF